MPEDLSSILETKSQSGNKQPSSNSALKNETPLVQSLTKRYTDAYIVARVTVTVGKFFKGLGLVIAILLILAGIIGGVVLGYQASNAPYPARSNDSAAALLGLLCFGIGVISAAYAGGILYILGVLISAQGQMLKAALDSAVNSSPFLTDGHRASMMSLPWGTENPAAITQASAVAGGYPASSPPVILPTQGLACRNCGSKLGPSAKFCGACGTTI